MNGPTGIGVRYMEYGNLLAEMERVLRDVPRPTDGRCDPELPDAVARDFLSDLGGVHCLEGVHRPLRGG